MCKILVAIISIIAGVIAVAAAAALAAVLVGEEREREMSTPYYLAWKWFKWLLWGRNLLLPTACSPYQQWYQEREREKEMKNQNQSSWEFVCIPTHRHKLLGRCLSLGFIVANNKKNVGCKEHSKNNKT